MWTYDLTNHKMLELKMVIALATMMFMVGIELNELHLIIKEPLVTSPSNNEVILRTNIGSLVFFLVYI